MIQIAIVGYGNVGKATHEALIQEQDMRLKAIVDRRAKLADVPVVRDISELTDVDVALLCTPSRQMPELATALLQQGIHTVDCYDVHTSIVNVRAKLDGIAKAQGKSAILSAGWDPGSDSVIRALVEAMAPKGLTYTNFGPGLSMGHTVVVKSIQGVKDALSLTVPVGAGIHRRMVYVELTPEAELTAVSKAIKEDAYFAHDETHVVQVESVRALRNEAHGVHIERNGVSGITANQSIEFRMRINNPALTGQVLVSAARAVVRQAPGCYTMPEIPPIDFLYGDKETLICRLV